ncbi:hypothetical protein [Falsirhodobacter sp. 20TX0035]|uniref:hypothetical protein n=1 Tax=Falsirhodobacter sp. 20TX0035 TaxID=3022019 RepID=UPI00232D46D7|nr:hypothetical protein [Falsirhodobacter sp. 20TX0035]MDB6453759.1 hypothetical protein [Falsirhodobacter sp. 20TX0035]
MKIDRKIAGILSAIEDGMYHPSMKAKMDGLEARQIELGQTLANRPEPPALRLHPSLGSRFRSEIARLSEALQTPDGKRKATTLLRGLISEVRMIPEVGAPGGHRIELIGELARILSLTEDGHVSNGHMWNSKKPPRLARAGSETLVAGAGFEPATFRL